MADEHRTVLGFEASQAVSELQKLDQALSTAAAGLDRAARSIQNYNQVAKQTDNGLKKNAANMNLVSQSMDQFGKTASRLPPSHPVSQALKKLDSDAKNASQSLTLTWKSMARIFTIQALHSAISKLTSTIGESVQEARDFGIAIAEVETIAGALGLTFDQLAEQARGVADAIGAPLDVVAEAQYQLYSNQVGGAVESTLALEASSKLSLAAVTSLNDAVGVVTGVMNSYGTSAARAEEISAKLFRTVELGRVRAAELSNTLGRTTVIASQLGVAYEEVLASIATMTIQGQKASDAQTRLTQVMLKLIKPTDAMKEAFAELGVVSAEAGIQAFGFQGFLEKLRETTDGSVTQFAQLWGRVRATAGALGLTGKAAERYHENLEKINDTTAELLDQKVEIIMRTNAKQVEKELNSLRVNTIVTLGTGIDKLLGSLFRFFGGAISTMHSLALAAGLAGLAFSLLRIKAVSALAAIATQAVATAVGMGTLSASVLKLATSPVLVATAVAVATTAIIKMFVTTQEEANKTLDLLKEFRTKELAEQLKAQDAAFKEQQKANKKIISDTQKFLTKIIKLRAEARDKAADLEFRATESLNNQLSNRLGSLRSFVGSITDLADTLDSRLKKLDDSAKGVGQSIEAFQFGRGLRDLNDKQKVYALINKSQELRKKSTDALNSGEKELAASLISQSQDYAKQGLQIADNTKNGGLQRKAAQEVVLSLSQQKSHYAGLANQAKNQKEAITEQLAPLTDQLSRLALLNKQLKDNEFEHRKGVKTDKEITEIAAERLRITSQIKKVIADISKQEGLAKQLGLGDSFAQITKTFRSFTGQEMDLTDLVTWNHEEMAAKLNVDLGEMQPLLNKILVATESETAEEAASKITRLPQEAEAVNDAAVRNIILTNEQKQLYSDVIGQYEAMEASLASQLSVLDRIAIAIPGEGLYEDEKFQQRIADMNAELLNFITIADKTAKLILFGNISDSPEIKAGIEQLRGLSTTLNEVGTPASIAGATAAIEAANLLQDGLRRMTELQAPTGDGPVVQEQLRALGDAMSESATETGNATTSITDDLTAIRTEAINTANALSLVRLGNSGGAQRAAHGAMFLAGGGFTPRGTDRIAAMLSRGESVNNADSTRKFASQIQAMNAGVTPIYRNAGGTTTIGDTNITVQGAPTPQQTAREVMTAFRREMRRKTSSF
jgi:TP901 family phage tail tape measure protein